jgi:glyoxylate reductase
LTETTADLAFALILATARRVVEGDLYLRSGAYTHWKLNQAQLGVDVTGACLGIYGMGKIGQAVARRAAGFSMRVIYHDPRRLDPADETALGATWVPMESLLEQADFLTLHAPATPENRGIINAHALAAMKANSIVVNTARGSLLNEADLVHALKAGHIAGAGLDVYENEPALHPGLADLHDRVVLLPHLGSATRQTRHEMARIAVRNMIAALAGERPPDLVNPCVLDGA